jgi:uncharacterized membrane protein YoaK (UPF0700 family)
MLRIARGQRKFHDTEWRVFAVRLKPRLPFFGSVAFRGVRRLNPVEEKHPVVLKVTADIRGRRRLGRAIGIVSFLVLLVAVWSGIGQRSFNCLQERPCLPNGFRGYVAALEFARTKSDVTAIVGDVGNANRDVMRRELNRDFLFIASYLALYLLLAAALARATYPFSSLLTVITVLAAVCTAGFDVVENVRSLHVLSLPLAGLEDSIVAGILDAAVIKWTFSFVTIALLAVAFRRDDRLSKMLRGLFLLTALAGIVGLISHPLMQLSFIPLVVGLLLLIWNGLFRPLRLIRDN